MASHVTEWSMLALAVLVIGTPTHSQPTAPPPPPLEPLVHGYVYFPSGGTHRIPSAGIDPIEHLAPQIPGSAFVVVDGKTDTVGSEEANLALAFRRARSVADELIARGVRAEQITLRACGERDPNRPTPDDTPEPLNRTASFDWRSTPWPQSLNCEQTAY